MQLETKNYTEIKEKESLKAKKNHMQLTSLELIQMNEFILHLLNKTKVIINGNS